MSALPCSFRLPPPSPEDFYRYAQLLVAGEPQPLYDSRLVWRGQHLQLLHGATVGEEIVETLLVPIRRWREQSDKDPRTFGLQQPREPVGGKLYALVGIDI